MMGVWCFFSLLCPRVFYYDYKAKKQQRKWDKENPQIPKHSKATMMRRRSSWTLGDYSPFFKSYSGDPSLLNSWVLSLLLGLDGDGNFELPCSRACYLHLTFLLLLSLASLFLFLPPLCFLIPSDSNFLSLPLQCNTAAAQLSWSCYN